MTYLEIFLILALNILLVGAAEGAAIYGIYRLAKWIITKTKNDKKG